MGAQRSSVFIYGLTDPRNSKIYYVGQSVWPGSRRCDHEKRARVCTRKTHARCMWIKDLQARKRRPGLVILEEVEKGRDWEALEQAWIQFGLKTGWPLTNLTLGGSGKRNLH